MTAVKYQSQIETLVEQLRKNYVYPAVGEQIAQYIQSRLDAGAYEDVADEEALAKVLAVDLLHVNNDKHLDVIFSPDVLAADVPPRQEESQSLDEEDALSPMWQCSDQMGQGISKVEILKGNVGLLALRGFLPLVSSGPMITAAFTLLAGTSALIVDLRSNFGGDGDAGDFLLSYLTPRSVHTNDTYWRPSDTTEPSHTLTYVPGTRYLAKRPVYVLTSDKTFSCAEKFSGTAQAIGRATVVGENTGGGGHPCHGFRLSDHLQVMISIGVTTNRVTKKGWEGVGVKPDVACAPQSALDVAHGLALRHIVGKDVKAEAMIAHLVAKDAKAELEKLEVQLQALNL
ncbi:hypothetical protein HKX48_000478 [Thoreauomyces humboldtii]|nr:hypothetical protein HKX48_000478 [Thoreauomyces humboldtii]